MHRCDTTEMILQYLCISACVYMYVHCVCIVYEYVLCDVKVHSYVTSHFFVSNPCNPISAVDTLASTVSARRRNAHLCFDVVFWSVTWVTRMTGVREITIATFCNLQPARFSLLGEAKDCVVPWSYKFWRIEKKVKKELRRRRDIRSNKGHEHSTFQEKMSFATQNQQFRDTKITKLRALKRKDRIMSM